MFWFDAVALVPIAVVLPTIPLDASAFTPIAMPLSVVAVAVVPSATEF
nr:hypothetical protein [Burkholderia stagnalis]